MKPDNLRLFHEPKGRLRLTIDEEKSYPTVKPVWSSPLTHPNRFLALLDGKGDEITMVVEPSELAPDSLAAVQLELHRRYLTAVVTGITHAKVEFGATYWSVESDRGPRDFVTQNLQENAIWLSESHLLLIDVDGNRFEIPDVAILDLGSRHYVNTIL